MASGPSGNPGSPSTGLTTPTQQPPQMTAYQPINYSGSFGSPYDNFGKGPQQSMPTQQQAPMQQPQIQQPMQQQQGLSPFGRLGQMGGIDGAPNPEYMAMMNRPDMRNEYNRRMNSKPNIWG